MVIRVVCTHCEKKLKIPEKFSGKTIKCPACKESLHVPAPEAEKEDTFALQPEEVDALDLPQRSGDDGKKKRAKRKATAMVEFEQAQAEEQASARTIGGAILQSFSYPLTGGGITLIIMATVCAVAAQFVCFVIPMMIAAMYGGWMYTLRSASGGPTQLLEFPANFFSELIWPGIHFLLVSTFSFLPMIITMIMLTMAAAGAVAATGGGSNYQYQQIEYEMTEEEEAQWAKQERMLRQAGMPPEQLGLAKETFKRTMAGNRQFKSGEGFSAPSNDSGQSAGLSAGLATAGIISILIMGASFLFGMAYFPMAIAQVGKYESIWAANPLIVFRSIMTIPGDYAISATLFFAAMIGSGIFLQIMNAILILVLGAAALLVALPMSAAVFYYLMSVAFTNLGFMCYRNEDRLGW